MCIGTGIQACLHMETNLCVQVHVCANVCAYAVDIGNLFECFSSLLIEEDSPSYTQISMVPAILADHLAPGISFPATEPCTLSIYMNSRKLNSCPYHLHSS